MVVHEVPVPRSIRLRGGALLESDPTTPLTDTPFVYTGTFRSVDAYHPDHEASKTVAQTSY